MGNRLLAAGAAAALLAAPMASFAGQPTEASQASPAPRQPERPGAHERHRRRDRGAFRRLPVVGARFGPTVGQDHAPLYHPGVDPARLRAERGLSPLQLAALGQDAYEHGDFGVASQAARLALSDDPRNPAAQAVLSLSQDRGSAAQAEFASARDAAASAASAAPVAVEAAPVFSAAAAAAVPTRTPGQERGQELAAQAAQALAIGDYTAAVQAASAALARDPADARAWNVRAVAQTRLGRYEDAVSDAGRALSLDARQPAALLTRSWASSKLGRYQEAENDARAALELDHSARDSRALEALAFALAGEGRRDDALEQLRRAADASPSLQPLYAKASELAQAQDIAALFDDPSRAAPAPAPARGSRRWLEAAVPAVSLGLWMIVLGLLPRREDEPRPDSSRWIKAGASAR